MGCHTWFRKPLVKGKENVQAFLRNEIENFRKKEWWDEECEKNVPLRLLSIENMNEIDAEDDEFLTIDSYLKYVQGEPVIFVSYEHDNDEPRIGGYPEIIISISVKLENDLDYINQAIDDAKYISDLEADWDENGALEISKDTFGTAKNIVLKYSQYMFNYFSILLPAPSINPVNNGSIDLLWKNADKVLLLNIKPNETLAHYYGLNTHTKIDFQGSIRINEIETFFATWLMDFKMES